jgi:hypothetical protein
LTTLAPALEKAMEELLDNKLIRRDGRLISIHRVVQEATNFHDVDDLQESFDNATRLVSEAFPSRHFGEGLYDQWNKCQVYIPHGVFLSRRYSDYIRPGKLTGSDTYMKLIANCAW